MSTCIFCQIIEGAIPSKPVYQDDDFIVIPDIHPAAPIHLLVIPKIHVFDFLETTESQLGKLTKLIKKIIQTQHIKNYRLVTNGGGAAFVPHLHVHIMGSVSQDRNL